jgi:putative hydrolase of HD superfamily
MQEFQALRIFNKLKSVYRFNTVDSRKESSAEHSWACLILADYFLSTTDYNFDRAKIYELLMYHDLVEIESGDIPLHDQKEPEERINRENKASIILKAKIIKPLDEKFERIFKEFKEQMTIESQFARAIDVLEAEIHELDHKEDWVGYTKEFIVSRKMHLFDKFPEMHKMYEEMVDYLEVNGYFLQT